MKIGLLGPYGLGNLGDAATQAAMIQNLRRRRPDADLWAISLNPEDSLRTFEIPAIPLCPSLPRRGFFRRIRWGANELWFSLLSLLRIWNFDLLLVSGGGQLDDAWGGARAHPLSLYRWSLLARLSRTRLMFVSVGAGPISSPRSGWLIRQAVERAEYRSYRDEGSSSLIHSLGVSNSNVVTPDLAFSFKPKGLQAADTSQETKIVGIGPMAHRDPRMCASPGPDRALYERYLQKLADFSCWLIKERGLQVLFYVGETNHDARVIEDLMPLLRNNGVDPNSQSVHCPTIANVSELVAAINTTQIAVASRFHGALLPMLLGKPVLALSYHPKVTDLMHDMGLSRYCFDIDDFNVELLCQQFDAIHEHRQCIQTELTQRTASANEKLNEQYDLLFPCQTSP